MVTMCPRAEAIFDRLAHDGQDPRRAGRLFGCDVIRARHRDPARFGRFDIFVRPDGAWTHDARRAYQWSLG